MGEIMKVKDKKIIVTGASGGVGKELTLQLLLRGAYVIAVDINNEALENLKKEANSNKLYIYKLDITDDTALEYFKQECFRTHAVIDGIINNAGVIQPFVNISKLDMNTINRVMDINFYGALKLTKLFINELLEREEAHIVNISSMGGFFPFPGQSVYGASKAALKLFTEGLYAELLNTNVHVTIVLPGAIATDIAKNSSVEIKENKDSKAYNMLSAKKAAKSIISSMQKNKFRLYLGNDSKFMNLIYILNSKLAIKYINKKMNKLVK